MIFPAHGAFQPTISESERFFKHECPDARAIGRDCMESPCTMHGGDNPRALAIDNRQGIAHCHTKCGRGWGMYQWVEQRHGLHGEEAWQYIYDIIGRPTESPWNLPFRAPTEITTQPWRLRLLAKNIEEGRAWLAVKAKGGTWQPRALYVYGQRIKVRFDNTEKPGDKQMLWYEPGPNKGWARKLNREKLTPLYHEGEVVAAAQNHGVIVLANGEKARDRVKSSGWPVAVTCLPNGEKSWNDQYAERFRGAEMVYVCCDNDLVGAGCGRKNAGSLIAAGIPARVVTLPGLPESGDLWDWDELGHSFEEFLAIAKDSPLGDPADAKRTRNSAPSNGGSNGQPAREEVPPGGEPPAPPSDAEAETGEPDMTRLERNDTGNGLRLIRFTKGDLCYTSALGWFVWSGAYWKPDTDECATYRYARDAMELTQMQATTKNDEGLWKHGHKTRNMGGLDNMVKAARRMLAVDIEVLDAKPRLIPLLNGTFDLDTGQLRPSRREDYFTRIIPHNYDPTLGPPKRFLEVLDELMGGGPDAGQEAIEKAWRMIEYLQKVFGYAITGDVSEKIFFCFYGRSGNNGKSTVLAILEMIFGDCSQRISASILTNTRAVGDNNRRMELATTRGARLVISSEPPAGHKFDEALLKTLTQGIGTISANLKYRDSITFTPTAKVFLETNEVPRIDTEDDAFIRRLHAIHFAVQISAERMNKRLVEELRPEADQITTWFIEGAMRREKEGLMRPLDVERNVQTLKEENVEGDGLGDFFREACTVGPQETTSCTFSELMAAYGAWCKKQEQRPLLPVHFSQRLRLRPQLFSVIKPTSKHAGNSTRVRGITPNDMRASIQPSRQYKDDD
jgi:putative DNA primase/helicase